MLTSKNLEEAQSLYEFLEKASVDLSNFTAFFLTYIKQRVGDTKREFFGEGKDPDAVKVIEQLMEDRRDIFNICHSSFHRKKSIVDAAFLTLQSEFSKVENFPKMLAAFIDNFIVQNGKNIESEVAPYLKKGNP